MRRLKIAVSGAGAIGRRHIELIEASDDLTLSGLCDPSPAARDLAAARGVVWYPDQAALIAASRPDGIIIASPNGLHLPMALECLAAQIPALIEKPVAESIASAALLTQAAGASDTPLLVGHHRRHNPLIKAVRETVRSGRLGRIVAINSLWLLKKPGPYFDASWRRVAGAGPVLMNFVHDVDNLRFIHGEITGVQAITSHAVRHFDVEDTAAVLLRFADGALGTALVSDTAAAPWSWELTSGENRDYPQGDQPCYLFAGTDGALSVPSGEMWAYDQGHAWFDRFNRSRLAFTPADPLVEQLRHFAAVIRGLEAPLIPVADAARTLAVIEAVKIAARDGGMIDPAELLKEIT